MIAIEEIPVERADEFWAIQFQYLVDDGMVVTEEEKAYFSSPGYRGHLETLMRRRPDQLHMIYFVRDGVRIGASQYCTYKTEDGKCFLISFCLYPEHRCQGLGKRCFAALAEHAGAQGARYFELNTHCRRSMRFWESVGFRYNGYDEAGSILLCRPPEERLPLTVTRLADLEDPALGWQLRRLENYLARNAPAQSEREGYILKSMERTAADFSHKFSPMELGSVHLYTAPSSREGFEKEVFADINLSHYPARDLAGVLTDLSKAINSFDINHRNRKKDEVHLNKHAMHLIRLLLTCLDILEKEEIITCREADLPLLMGIRQGEYMQEDGSFRPEFFEILSDLEKRVEYAKENTSLPTESNQDRVEELVMEINEMAIRT